MSTYHAAFSSFGFTVCSSNDLIIVSLSLSNLYYNNRHHLSKLTMTWTRVRRGASLREGERTMASVSRSKCHNIRKGSTRCHEFATLRPIKDVQKRDRDDARRLFAFTFLYRSLTARLNLIRLQLHIKKPINRQWHRTNRPHRPDLILPPNRPNNTH